MTAVDDVERLPYWSALSEEEKAAVRQNAVIRTYAEGTFIHGHGCGDACLGMVYVLSGSVRVLMLSEEGREITLFRLETGDSCVLSASCILSQITYETQMITSEPTRLLIVNAGAYGKLMQGNMNVRCFTYALAVERSNAVIWVLQEILFARFDQRLARFLLEQTSQAGKDEIRMTQEEMARNVNSAREVVARMLKQFSSDGLISIGRGTVTVLNKTGLKKLL